MRPLSASRGIPTAIIIPTGSLFTKLIRNPRRRVLLSRLPPSLKVCHAIRPAISATSKVQELKQQDSSSAASTSKWGEFASRVSGEWDGYGSEFTNEGKPVELPEAVVPQAFREWEVQVFDWQTQCPTLAETGKPLLTYKLIKLLPTVGCEADAATRYSIDERIVGGADNRLSAFAYDDTGSYVAVWLLEDRNEFRLVELEHCLVDPRNQEARLRIIQCVRIEKTVLKLQKIKVFSEQWYGPFRNGEQLGGCAIRESGFASTIYLDPSEVLGVWLGTCTAANFENSQVASSKFLDTFHELLDAQPQKLVRDKEGLVTLPKQLWCSLREHEDGETWGEVGWLLDHGRAMTSRCIFSKGGSLKAIVHGHEAAVLEDI